MFCYGYIKAAKLGKGSEALVRNESQDWMNEVPQAEYDFDMLFGLNISDIFSHFLSLGTEGNGL